MYEETKDRVVSLRELEEVIEPKVVHVAVHDAVGVINGALKNNVSRMLEVIQSQDHTNLSIIINSLERKKTADNKSQIDGVINATRALTQLVSGGDHPIILERMAARKHWGFDENNRKDGVSLKTWVAEESNKILENLQTKVFLKPPSSIAAVGSESVTGRSNSPDQLGHV